MRDIFRNSFVQLLIVFVVYAGAVAAGLLPMIIRPELFALALGLLGCFLHYSKKKIALDARIVWAALGLIVVTRMVWYFFTSVPLGYDPGMYAFAFNHPVAEDWLLRGFPLIFSLVGFALAKIFTAAFIVKWGAVALSVGLGYVVYHYTCRIFNKQIGLLAIILYAFSYTMYKVFWWNYIKNLIGMGLLLIAYFYLQQVKYTKKLGKNRYLFVLSAALIAGFHRPAFLIFGLSYLTYVAYSFFLRKRVLHRIYDGIAILALAFLFNIDRIQPFILDMLWGAGEAVTSGTVGGGTFFTLFRYWKLSFVYVPFALIGLCHFWKKNKGLSIAFILTFATVLFEILFFKRFIIYMDFLMIIFAAAGFYVLLSYKKWLGYVTLGAFLVVLGIFFFQGIRSDAPLISDEEFSYIGSLDLPDEALLIVTSSTYSTWMKGYYDGTIMAPGLFDNNPWNRGTWMRFWTNSTVRAELVGNLSYSPVYIHQGARQPKMEWNDCFEQEDEWLYRFVC